MILTIINGVVIAGLVLFQSLTRQEANSKLLSYSYDENQGVYRTRVDAANGVVTSALTADRTP